MIIFSNFINSINIYILSIERQIKLLRNKFEIQFKCFFREKKFPSLDGFEPSTFRLTAERANQLRHRDT